MTEPTDTLLPCPFCGGDARHDAHADDCYFILHRKLNNSGSDMSPAFEVLAAWNRRASQPTKAQAVAVPLALHQRDSIKANAWRETPLHGYFDADEIIDAVEAAHGIK